MINFLSRNRLVSTQQVQRHTTTTTFLIEISHAHMYSNKHYDIKHDAIDNHKSISRRINVIPRNVASCSAEKSFSQYDGIFFI